ncbi:MAG TPA: guanylate kinase [Candidatus Omnitrophota bacterium]|nr:guanylate kinase [Candidatus Omnitrophota bacterium]
MAKQRLKKGLIFVISGPSGSGKTTLLKKLLNDKALSPRLVKSISLTTRPKRSVEKEGRDYFFISRKEFQQKKRAKKLLEWTRYLGYDYATPKDFVEGNLAKGRSAALCLDLKGGARIKKLYPKNSVTIFIKPPSIAQLQERIEARCKETRRLEIKKRLGLARRELLFAGKYDYSLVNRNLGAALEELKEIVLIETGR